MGDSNNICVSTDDMTYYKINRRYYKHFNIFKQEQTKKKIEKLFLSNELTKKDVEKILYKNFEDKILQRL